MSDVLVAKEVRARMNAAISGLSILVGGVAQSVTVLRRPPAGWLVPAGQLPAVYVFNTGERIQPDSLEADRRDHLFDVVVMAGSSEDPSDQLDDLQLAIERAILASGGLGGIAAEVALSAVSIAHDQAGVVFGVRTMSYGVVCYVTRADPSF